MYTLYKINSDELNDNFITAIKALFPHQSIEIAISQTTEIEQDETAYLLNNPVNKAKLLAAIAQVENKQLIDVDLESL
jgi:antitoxin YefM